VNNFIQRYRNAMTAISQIRNGEWVPTYNNNSRKCLTAERKGLKLWIGNGAWFCDIGEEPKYFGLFWRHIVWHSAARKLKTNSERSHKRDTCVPKLT